METLGQDKEEIRRDKSILTPKGGASLRGRVWIFQMEKSTVLLAGFILLLSKCVIAREVGTIQDPLSREPRGQDRFHNKEMKENAQDMQEIRQAKLPCSSQTYTHYLDRGESVMFTSPRYPKRYPNSKNCRWRLERLHSDITIKVNCETFSLQRKRKGRYRDYLLLDSEIFCGNNRPENFTAQEDSLDIHFHSNRRRRFRGFSCTATAVSSQSTSTVTASTTTNTITTTTNTMTMTSSDTSCKCGIPNRGERIIGGVVTEVNEYPWQVAMAYTGNDDFQDQYCGGSIISKRWCLTAAHCEVSTTDQVIVGAHDLVMPPPSSRRVNIDTVVNHMYDAGTFDNDIALVKLAEDLDFTNVGLAPVCLPPLGSTNSYAGDKAIITGWGELDNGNFPTKLYEVEVDVVTNAVCKLDYTPEEITDNMICAGADAGGKDSCQGDSGGPVATASGGVYTQIGVVSWGTDCGHEDYYGVNTRVTRYIAWIKNITGYICHDS